MQRSPRSRCVSLAIEGLRVRIPWSAPFERPRQSRNSFVTLTIVNGCVAKSATIASTRHRGHRITPGTEAVTIDHVLRRTGRFLRRRRQIPTALEG